MIRNRLALTVAFALAGIPALGAQSSNGTPPQFELRIDAQPLSQALQELAKQAHVQIIFFSKVTDGYIAPVLNGKFTTEEALTRLLNDSRLTYRLLNPGTIEIRPLASVNSLDAPGATDLPGAAVRVDGTHSADETANAENRSSRSIRLAQSVGTSRDDSDDEDLKTESPTAKKGMLPEVLVRGSKSLDVDIERTRDDAQPYVVYSRVELERSGAQDLESFFKQKLTSAANYSSQRQTVSGNNASYIDLRGMSIGTSSSAQTVVLVDGRRLASGNNNGGLRQADINHIPMSAIERVEVLATTASGIYGGGATGGVINIVLRRDYSGIETTLTYEDSFDGGGGSRRFDMAGGYPLEGGRTNITFTGSYSEARELTHADRDYFAQARALTVKNNPGSIFVPGFPELGATTNIASADGSNLVLKPQFGGTALGSAITYVPDGYQGAGSDNGAGLVANAGQYNLDLVDTPQYNGGKYASILGAPTIKSVSMTARRDFTELVNAFVDVAYSENSGENLTDFSSGYFSVAADAPANPFAQDVVVRTPTFGASQIMKADDKTLRATAGVILKLPGNWNAEGDYNWSRVKRVSSDNVGVDTVLAGPAIAAGVTATGTPFNVFQDSRAAGVDYGQFVRTSVVFPNVSTRLDDVALRLAGPLPLHLPGGAIKLSTAVEHRKESLDATEIVLIDSDFKVTYFPRNRPSTARTRRCCCLCLPRRMGCPVQTCWS